MKGKPTREQFMLGQAIAGTVLAANPPFCSVAEENGGVEEINRDPDYVYNVATVVADVVNNDHMAVEDLQDILQAALDVIAERKGTPNEPAVEQ